jgi:glycosyltransferase involved in cell wall biosynthesis
LISPRVTIVIPTFNRAGRVSSAIKSAIDQTEKCHIIVVDHGSNDKTSEVVRRFGSTVEYVRRNADSGPIYSWIDGVVRAKTEFVKILFDDDILDNSFVSDALSLMGDQVGFVASNARVVDLDSGEVIRKSLFYRGFSRSGVFRCSGINGVLVSRIMISPSALLMRKVDLLSGLYMGSLPFQISSHHGAGPDHFVKLLAMIRYPKYGIIDKELVTFGSHQGSITIKSSAEPQERKSLASVYNETWIFYLQLKLIRLLTPVYYCVGAIVTSMESIQGRFVRRKQITNSRNF